jgi:hypothetical protein
VTHSPLVEAAGDYLSRGLQVIALSGKTPNVTVHRRGLHQPARRRRRDGGRLGGPPSVFEHPDTTGIGILVKWPFVVVDIDGEEGAIQWMTLTGRGRDDPARGVAQTGRGLHLWFLTGQETGTIKLGPKLDLKGEGGYVAAPPSRHPDGHTYEWLIPPGDHLPPPVPAALAEVIADHLFDLGMRAKTAEVRKVAWGPRYVPGATTFYAQPGFEGLFIGMREAADGNRNNYLHWAAATLAEEGGEEGDFAELGDIALALGLEPVEVKRTLRSARRNRG